MLKSTDDLRISDIRELRTPAEVMREFPRTDAATRTVLASRHALHNILHGADDRLAVVVGPCSIHDPAAAIDYAKRLLAAARAPRRPARDRHARLFREAAHHGRLEGPDQRPRSRRQLQDRQRPAPRPQPAARHHRSRPARRLRIPRHDDAAILRRPRRLGRHRRAHHREPGPSRTGLRPQLPGRLQERHRRQCAHRARRGEVGQPAAPFPRRHQGRPLRHRLDHRQ